MLILMRHVGQKIIIGENIEVSIVRLYGNQVYVGIEAPKNVSVHREEIFERIKKEGFNEKHSLINKNEDNRGNS